MPNKLTKGTSIHPRSFRFYLTYAAVSWATWLSCCHTVHQTNQQQTQYKNAGNMWQKADCHFTPECENSFLGTSPLNNFRLLNGGTRQRTLGGSCWCCWWLDNAGRPRCPLTCATPTEMDSKSDEQQEHLPNNTADTRWVRCRFTIINGDGTCG